jgi:hypothetical protein
LVQSLILVSSCVQAGDNVGLLLRGLKRGDVERGQVRIYDFKITWRKEWEIFVHDCLHQIYLHVILYFYRWRFSAVSLSHFLQF